MKHLRTRRRRICSAAALSALIGPWARPLRAQGGRPIRIVVPFTPGGSTDILARALAPKLQQALGINVVVDNKPGAGGSLGAAKVAKAEADGLTLLMGHIGTLAVNPSIYDKLPSDPLKSFAPVAHVARVPNVLVVSVGAPDKDFQAFIARALAVSGARRIAALPEAPTVAESGYAGFDADQWYGVVAPAGTPVAVVARLNAEINKALAWPDVAQQLACEGAEAAPGSPQEFGRLIAREVPRWAAVVRAGNIKPT